MSTVSSGRPKYQLGMRASVQESSGHTPESLSTNLSYGIYTCRLASQVLMCRVLNHGRKLNSLDSYAFLCCTMVPPTGNGSSWRYFFIRIQDTPIRSLTTNTSTSTPPQHINHGAKTSKQVPLRPYPSRKKPPSRPPGPSAIAHRNASKTNSIIPQTHQT